MSSLQNDSRSLKLINLYFTSQTSHKMSSYVMTCIYNKLGTKYMDSVGTTTGAITSELVTKSLWHNLIEFEDEILPLFQTFYCLSFGAQSLQNRN